MYDAVIIGSGPGGYVTAIRSAQNGLKTLLIDEKYMGGVCLNVGCIPSKALIHAAHVAQIQNEAADMGIEFQSPIINIEKLQKWRADIVSRLTKGIERLVSGNGAEIKMGRARFSGPGTIEMTKSDGSTETIKARNIVLATGSSPINIPSFPLSDERIWDSTRALESNMIPGKLAVIGGGYIGIELGQVYAGLGTDVTVIEATAGLLPTMPKDLVQPLMRRLREQKVNVLTNAKAAGFRETKNALVLDVETKTGPIEVPADRVLVTVGRRPNSDDLGLDRIGLTPDDRGFIPVNDRLETGVEGVYAIGDVTGNPMLAHRASKMGEVCADVMAGKPAAFDAAAIPAVVFTDPEIAMTGLTEKEARDAGNDVVVGKFPFAASGRAMTMNHTRGFVKIVAERDSGAILGVQAVGHAVSDLIAEGTLSIEMGAMLDDVAATIHPHPTLSESIMEAALVALGEAVHILPR